MKQESYQVELGQNAPDFTLVDTVTKDTLTYQNIRGERGTMVMFICNHCPFVIHVIDELVRVANDYRVLGFGFVAISSNDVEKYPQDGPFEMWQFARKRNMSFPYLYDETQEIAKSYNAACTPDLYIYDNEDKLVYHGQLDDSRPQNGVAVNGRSVREVLDALYYSKPLPKIQKPSVGCNIKWKE